MSSVAQDPPIDLGPEWTIVHAAAHRERLVTALADGRNRLAIDLSQVADIDSAGVQLLLATRRSLAERGGDLELPQASSAVRHALQVFGLAELAIPSP